MSLLLQLIIYSAFTFLVCLVMIIIGIFIGEIGGHWMDGIL